MVFYASAVFVKKREVLNILSRENRHYMQISIFPKFRPQNKSWELLTMFPWISSL